MESALACLLVIVLVSACDESEQRAISPGAVGEFATAVARENSIDPPEEDDHRILAGTFGQTLLPEADRVFFARGGDIWQISRAGSPSPVFEDQDVIAFSASARGERLALVHTRTGEETTGETTMSLVLPRGTIVHDLAQILHSPFSTDLGPIEAIAVTPDGSELALAYQSGQLLVASLEGQVQQLVPAAQQRRPGLLKWSADGRIVAWLDPWMPSEASSLWVAIPENGYQQVVIDAEDRGRGVVDANWIPGTTMLAATISTGGTIQHGGDLFLVDALTGDRELLVSSGQFAPVAGVVDIAVTPGGDRLALTVFTPGDTRPGFEGLWILDLESGSMSEVEIDATGWVTDLWWLGDRLLMRLIDEPQTSLPGAYTGLESFKLLEYNPTNNALIERYDDVEENLQN